MHDAADPAAQPVSQLVQREPVVCDPSATAREVARRMAEAETSAALVRLADGELGIVTDRDLRDRVVAAGEAADAPVTEIMSAPAFTVSPGRLGADVMLEMLDRDLHHVPVVRPDGRALGILEDRDLLAAEAEGPFVLRRAIGAAGEAAELRRTAAKLRPAVIALHDAGAPPARIGSIIAVVVDALTRRLIELAVDDLGPLPCPLTWLALGSMGRREVVPSSDVDSALVWDGAGDEPERYMRELGSRVVAELTACGFVGDARGVTAARPLFDSSFDSWRSIIHTAIQHAERQPDSALIFISLLSDARRAVEIGDTRDVLEELGEAWHRERVMRLLLRLALVHSPPRRVKRPFDVKAQGLHPIVDLARCASLAAGARLTSTHERLDHAATAGTLDADKARTLADAFDLFWRLRLDHQVEQERAGREPDNTIDPGELSRVTRGYVREAFHAVRAVQRSLRKELELPG